MNNTRLESSYLTLDFILLFHQLHSAIGCVRNLVTPGLNHKHYILICNI